MHQAAASIGVTLFSLVNLAVWLFSGYAFPLFVLFAFFIVRRVVRAGGTVGKWYQKDPERNAWRFALYLTLPRLGVMLLFVLVAWLRNAKISSEVMGPAYWLFVGLTPEGFT